MYTTYALLQDSGVPRDIHVDYYRPALEVQAYASGVGGEKDLAVRILPEPCH